VCEVVLRIGDESELVVVGCWVWRVMGISPVDDGD
jgi:hypothetical protein